MSTGRAFLVSRESVSRPPAIFVFTRDLCATRSVTYLTPAVTGLAERSKRHVTVPEGAIVTWMSPLLCVV
jgi:hypothetical protein